MVVKLVLKIVQFFGIMGYQCFFRFEVGLKGSDRRIDLEREIESK